MRTRIGILFLLLVLSAATASAQGRTPNYDQVSCAGVYSKASVPYDTYVISGEDARVKTTFGQGDLVYVNKGSSQGVKPGDEFWVTRPEKDTYQPKWFNSQPWLKKAMGRNWKDLGKLRVIKAEANVSIAEIVFSCDYIQRGDYVQAYAEQPRPTMKRSHLDRWAEPTGKGSSMVVSAKDWPGSIGTNDIVYVNAGSSQGARVGDYFRFFRYQGTRNQFAYDTWRYQDRNWNFGKTPKKHNWDQLPREVEGEGIVVRVGENSSTVLVTHSFREIYLGDYAEIENPEPVVEAAAPSFPEPKAANRSPSVSCSVDRSPVTAGERVRISARASDPDNDPLTYAWRSNGGEIVGSGASVMLDTTGLRPGRYTVTGQVSDGISAAVDCAVEVMVQPAAAPEQASKTNECIFRQASAGVDNVCKRILDDVALRLKNDPQSRVVVVGYADPSESGAARLAQQRADNARQYLLSSGIAGVRVDARPAGGQAGAGRANRRVDLIWVPAGATY